MVEPPLKICVVDRGLHEVGDHILRLAIFVELPKFLQLLKRVFVIDHVVFLERLLVALILLVLLDILKVIL